MIIIRPIIGIITKSVFSTENNLMCGVYYAICESVENSGGICVGILPLNMYNQDYLLSLDGIIFQGGDDYEDYEFRYLELAYKNNIPVLGICAGMQLMGELFGGKLKEVYDHKKKEATYAHEITISPNSKLYQIFQKEKIEVNSRHSFWVEGTHLLVSATCGDVAEAIEDPDKSFFIGVQWHPELMFSYDDDQKKLFDYFIKVCRGDL